MRPSSGSRVAATVAGGCRGELRDDDDDDCPNSDDDSSLLVAYSSCTDSAPTTPVAKLALLSSGPALGLHDRWGMPGLRPPHEKDPQTQVYRDCLCLEGLPLGKGK